MGRNRFSAALACAAAFAGLAVEARAQDDDVDFDRRGFTYAAGDDLRVNVGGRLHLDAATYESEVTTFEDQAEVRRARVEVSVQAAERWRFRADYEFAPLNPGWRNLWAEYAVSEDVRLRAGNMIAPFSMEDMAGSNGLSLMERSLANALAPGYGLGGVVRANGSNWSASVGYFDEPFELDNTSRSSLGRGWSGRVTYAPIRRSREVVHLGLGLQAREIPEGDVVRLGSRPESGLAESRLLNTGSLSGTEEYLAANLEAAWMRGPFAIQAEYMAMELDRTTRPDPTFQGGYVQATWTLTGEPRRYSRSTGILGDLRVRRGEPAVEFAARYSVLDLESETVSGGREENLTLGANWYLNRNVRLMANFIHAEAEPNFRGVDEAVDILQARLQVHF